MEDSNADISYIEIHRATAKNKKFKAIVYTQNGRKKTVNFGDTNYEDYTYHHNEKRK